MRSALFTLVVIGSASTAFAQQPFSTDEADLVKPRAAKISVGAEFDALQPEDTDHDRQTTLLMRAGYGAAKNLEVELAAPVIFLANAIEPNARGYGDTSMSAKYQVRDDARGPAVALAFSVQAPTGDADRDIGSGVTMTWLNAIVGRKVSSKTNVSANLGFMPTGNPSVGALGINARRGRIVTFGGLVNTEITSKLKLGAEVNGAATTTGDAAHQLHVLSAGNYELRRGVTLYGGVVVGHYTRTPRYGVLGGVTITVPPSAAGE
jgi:Putative MetA-pathway of phenol degradation